MTRRDRMQIMVSILNTCTRGANKTRIVYQANLNFRTVNPYLDLLEKKGLLQVTEDRTTLYKTTPRGLELINNFSSINEMLNL
ncbi:winged helix-turn-helix domain-containing protein [Methanotrichaceae archaeon M04Ac]|uniref:Winged helix-turn-helix domain-containing protein n=1 Tax=Candidatus Methanocrinis alkalitolerans TaxID=3033395 RepID=A0ABT5XG92_9EURY|nr:winged helix-turn-helix domain-containing protein [Candidatus Methanocrinis alkalitolerans]MDF0593680.1 winged helix-turn-helix domain-containing protein [Candidatus Methanocrinis alkalitolerans]